MVLCVTCWLTACIDKSAALQLFHQRDAAAADGANSVALDGVGNTCVAGPCLHEVIASLEFKPTTVTPAAGQISTIGLHLVAKDASGKLITGPYASPVKLALSAPSAQMYTLTTAGIYAQNPQDPAKLANPDSIAYDAAAGITYVLATNSCQIFAASNSLGLQWIGGTGGTGFVNTANPKTSSFYYPPALTMDIAGGTTNLYIMDKNNGVIRKMNAGGVSTFAGTPCVACKQGFFDAVGTSASFNNSYGIGIDSKHDLLVADTGNGRIRRVSTVDASVTTLTTDGIFVANPSNPAVFTQPISVASDAAGHIYVGTWLDGGGKVYLIAGKQRTVVASDFGTGGAVGLALAADGTVYFTDPSNHVVRAIAPDAARSLSVVAGLVGQAGATDGHSQQAKFDKPTGMAMDALESLYLGDAAGQVRRIDTAATLTLNSTSVSDAASADAVAVSYAGTGTAPRQVCATASGVTPTCVTLTPAL